MAIVAHNYIFSDINDFQKKIIIIVFVCFLSSLGAKNLNAALSGNSLYNLSVDENDNVTIYYSNHTLLYFMKLLGESPDKLFCPTFNVQGKYLKQNQCWKELDTPRIYVDDSGNVFKMLSDNDRYFLVHTDHSGAMIKKKEIKPFPDIKLCKIIFIDFDKNGYIYLTSAIECVTDNELKGSVRKFDKNFLCIWTITEKIGYIREIAIDSKGNIYTIGLNKYINKYTKDGKFEIRWNAHPPIYGESWHDKQKYEKSAKYVNKESSLEDLVRALVYGDFDQEDKISALIKLKIFDNSSRLVKFMDLYYEDSFKILHIIRDVSGDDFIKDLFNKYCDNDVFQFNIKRIYLAAYIAYYLPLSQNKDKDLINKLFDVLITSIQYNDPLCSAKYFSLALLYENYFKYKF